MKIQFTLILIAISLIKVSGQNSFEFTYKKYHSWCYSLFEMENRYYAMGETAFDGTGIRAFITRITDESDTTYKEIIKQDTSTWFFFGTPIDNGDILLVGRMTDLISQEQKLYCCEMTENLEIVNEKFYSIIPEGYQSLVFYDMVIDNDGNMVLAGRFDDYSICDSFVLVRINQNGDLIAFEHHVSILYSGRPYGELMERQDGSYYYFNGGSFSWVKIDQNLQYVTGGYMYPHYIGTNATAIYLPNGNILFAGMADVGTSYYDIVLNVYSDNLQWLSDTAFVEVGRQSPPIYKGLDYFDPDNIWLVAFNDWIAPTGTEVYKFYILDSQLNVKGYKYFGGDNDYTFTYLKATSDGGCIVTGMIRREEGSNSRGAIIKKVMPEDILTGNDEKVFSDFKDVLVYPNPFSDKVYLKTDRNDLTFNLFNSRGQLVYQGSITDRIKNEIDVGNLQKGIYVYSITNSAGKAIDGGKMLKK